MLNHTLKALLAMLGMAFLLVPAANAAKPGETAVCHAPPGNPENTKLIEVGASGNAVNSHLAHGDWLATAAVCADDIDDNNCDGIADDPDADNYDCVILTGNADATCLDRVCIEPPPEDPCPCWTEAEIGAIDGTLWNGQMTNVLLVFPSGQGNPDFFGIREYEIPPANEEEEWVYDGYLFAGVRGVGGAGFYCRYDDNRGGSESTIYRNLRINFGELTQPEWEACKTSLRARIVEAGGPAE